MQRWSPSGSVASEQRVLTELPGVAWCLAGSSALGDRYWVEVERFAHGLVRVVATSRGVEL